MDNAAVADISLETDINPTGLLALQLLQALQQGLDKNSAELALDLAALCRTLVTLSRRLQYGYTFNTSDTETLKHQLQVMRTILTMKGQPVPQLESSVAVTSSTINRVIAGTKYIFALPVYHLYYPWGDIVQQMHKEDRYNLRSNCVLETDLELVNRASTEQAQRETTKNPERPIYEHIGRLDGGESMYDPFFLSRTPEQARDFFTQGRVFAMLWSTDGYEAISYGVAHYDYSIEAHRHRMIVTEGVYSGPYEGPTTARYLLVIQGGGSSALCLSIVTLPYLDPDAQRYIRITMADSQSQHFEGVQIQIVPKPHYIPGPKRQLDVPPPHLTPTSDLPLPCSEKVASDVMEELAGQRKPFAPVMDVLEVQRVKQLIDRKFYIDLKRIVEVESGIKVRNVGIVGESAAWTQIRAMFAI